MANMWDKNTGQKSCPVLLIKCLIFQNILAGCFQSGDIGGQRIPDRRNINGAVSMDVEVASVLDDTPGNHSILLFNILRKLGNQLANLDNTHAAGILKKVVTFESAKVVVVAIQIICDTIAIGNNFLKDDSITRFDRAPPRLSQSYQGSFDQRLRW